MAGLKKLNSMKLIVSLVISILEKILSWFIRFISKEIKEKHTIKEDNKKVEENTKKYEESKTEQERRKNAENLFNGD